MKIPLLKKTRKEKAGAAATVSGILLVAGILATPLAIAQTPHELVKEGNKDVVEKDLDDALVKYMKAAAELDTLRPELLYNLGGVYARKGEIGRADTLYRSLPEGTRENLLGRAAYNRGTALAQSEQYDQAVPALIDALKRNPKDEDAKINLELALRRMQEQQQQQQQDQENQEDQEQQEDKEKQDQQDEQDKKEEEQKDQQDQQDQQPPEEQDQQQPQPEEQDIDREMAERLLAQMQQDEKELLKEVVRQQIPPAQKGTKKPW